MLKSLGWRLSTGEAFNQSFNHFLRESSIKLPVSWLRCKETLCTQMMRISTRSLSVFSKMLSQHGSPKDVHQGPWFRAQSTMKPSRWRWITNWELPGGKNYRNFLSKEVLRSLTSCFNANWWFRWFLISSESGCSAWTESSRLSGLARANTELWIPNFETQFAYKFVEISSQNDLSFSNCTNLIAHELEANSNNANN